MLIVYSFERLDFVCTRAKSFFCFIKGLRYIICSFKIKKTFNHFIQAVEILLIFISFL